MTTYFHDRLDLLGDRMQALNSEQIQYVRAPARPGYRQQRQPNTTREQLTINLQATLARGALVETETTPQLVVASHMQDFVVNTAELGNIRPRAGDRIHRANGQTYEVTPIGDQHYTYVTSQQKRMRIHARRVT